MANKYGKSIVQDIEGLTQGPSLGQAFGTGISEGLGSLLQGQLSQMLQRREGKRTSAGLSGIFPPEVAKAISNLPPKLQEIATKGLFDQMKNQGKNKGLADAVDGTGGGSGPDGSNFINPRKQLQEQQHTKELQELEQEQQKELEQLQPFYPQRDAPMNEHQALQSIMSGLYTPVSQSDEQQQQKMQQLQEQHQQKKDLLLYKQQKEAEKLAREPKGVKSDNTKMLRNALNVPGLNSNERIRLIGDLNKQMNEDRKFAFKHSKKLLDEIDTKAAGADDELVNLKEMEYLVKQGNMPDPLIVKGLDLIGIDLPALHGADAEQFTKMSLGYLRDMKSYFGARVTQQEVAMFLKSVPTLMQSDEGKRRVMKSLKYFARAKQLRRSAKNQLLRENNGVPYLNMNEMIESRTSDKREALYTKLKKQIRSAGELKTGQKVNKLPNAAMYPGAEATGDDGAKYKSVDGKWIKKG